MLSPSGCLRPAQDLERQSIDRNATVDDWTIGGTQGLVRRFVYVLKPTLGCLCPSQGLERQSVDGNDHPDDWAIVPTR